MGNAEILHHLCIKDFELNGEIMIIVIVVYCQSIAYRHTTFKMTCIITASIYKHVFYDENILLSSVVRFIITYFAFLIFVLEQYQTHNFVFYIGVYICTLEKYYLLYIIFNIHICI